MGAHFIVIRTQAEYESALEHINTDLEMYDFELSDKMTSYEYNLYLQDIQYYLNVLYEKYRVLEDLNNYLEDYSEKKINGLLDNIKENEAKLATSLDKYLSSKSRTYDVKWNISNLDTVKDRDGKELKKALLNSDNYLTFNGHKAGELKINSIVKEENISTESDNLLTCLEDGVYLTSYNVDVPQTIKETLYVDVDNIEAIDNLSLKPINCTIEYKGLSDSQKAIYEITCNSLSKVNENFEYEPYVQGNLEEIGNKSSRKRLIWTTVQEYSEKMREKKNLNNKNKFRTDIKNTNNTNKKNTESSETAAAYASDIER